MWMSAEVLASGWLTRTRLRVLDESLAREGRGAARVRLRIGEALDRLAVMSGFGELGFSSLAAYAHERCERGGRWAVASRTLARRLAGLPRTRRALEEGTLLWSMAEVLAAHATAENEAELLEVARERTVRQMKGWLAPRADVAGCEEEERRDLRVSVGFDEIAIVEATRVLVGALDNTAVTDEALLEAMLAEGESALLGLETAGRGRSRGDDEDEAERARVAACERESRARREECAEGRIPAVRAVGLFDEHGDAPLGSTARELDAEIRKCCALLARRDLEMGRLWRIMVEHGGWAKLGYGSDAQYARERVGVSLSSLRHRCTLARRADRLPQLVAALEAGVLGYEATLLVGRVATPDTVDAWVVRAKRRTLKHLREEVAVVELRARLGDDGPFLPPEDAELEDAAALERAALSGELFATLIDAKPPGRQISVRAGAGRELRLMVSDGLLAHYRRLRARFRGVAPPEASFIGFLGLAVWEAWLPTVRGLVGRWQHIFRRDRYRCASPVCMRRDVTPHHLVFQSHGGGDEDENLVSLCGTCHLEGIHGGRLRASPPASRIGWSIGRRPIMVVDGRERRLID